MRNRRPISHSRLVRLAYVSLTIGISVAMLLAVALALALPRAANAYHDSLYVVCPDPISEGDSAQMKIARSGYRIVNTIVFTHEGAYTASPDDFVEYHGVNFESGSNERALWVPIVTKEDSLPEHDEKFAIGFLSDGLWHQCMVTIEDDDAPEVQLVSIASEPVDGYAYRAGESIDVTVMLNGKVDVEGTPLLALYLGDGDDSTWRGAEYHSGSGTRLLTFRYNVRAGDFDSDGLNVGSAGVAEDHTPAYGFSGNIYAEGTDVLINYAHPGVQGDRGQMVDGRPYVQKVWVSSSPPAGWSAYRANQAIEVSFAYDTAVVVEGDVSAGLYVGYDHSNWDEAVRRADYLRGSGSDTLVFGYTVRPGDMDPKGIMISLDTHSNGFGGNGSVKAKGTDVEQNPDYLGTSHQPRHKVDTAPPAITSVSITSQPANSESYAAGEAISVEVLFSEKIEFHVDMHVELDVGGASRQAVFDSVLKRGSSNVLVFQYVVQEGDTDADGIGIGANSLRLNEGGIHDGAGNAADLSFPALSADPNHKVAASPATGGGEAPAEHGGGPGEAAR